MAFDTPTLLVTTVYITGLLGGLLLFSWAQARGGNALAIAGMTFLLIALGIGLLALRGDMPSTAVLNLASGILVLAHGLLYSSVRMFNHRPPIFLSASVGAFLWLVASEFDVVAVSTEVQAVVVSVIVAGYSFLLSIEFGHTRAERLPSAHAASAVSAAHGLFFLARAVFIIGWRAHPAAVAFAQSWSSIITFEALTAGVVLAFLLMSMSKERAEAGFRHAALIDFLTGTFNRRAFIKEAEHIIAREARKGRTLALLIFDLDRFKQINDEHGHSIGDRALQAFSSIALRLLPTGSIFGRLGGEEFGALIPAAEIEQACSLGEQIREAFAGVTICADGEEVRATVSAGVASSPQAQVGLSELLSGADAALYMAKTQGRNRVRAHGLDDQLSAAMRQRAEREPQLEARSI
jgi:diguanylate cyclase (GGDEF)-like protein